MTRNWRNPSDVSDLPLFGKPADPAAEQRRELSRVRVNIKSAVLDFLRGVLEKRPPYFYASELQEYVRGRHPTAPASADRVLRDLRKAGFVRYDVVSRSASLYRVTLVARPGKTRDADLEDL